MYTKHVFTYIASLNLHFTEKANKTSRNWTQVCALNSEEYTHIHTHTHTTVVGRTPLLWNEENFSKEPIYRAENR